MTHETMRYVLMEEIVYKGSAEETHVLFTGLENVLFFKFLIGMVN